MSYTLAVSDFREARRQAAMEQILARLTGRSADLLSYEEVREKLGAKASTQVELKDIPLDAIVGSVGRYADFTRSFLPKYDSNEERWARVQMAINDLAGVPPIEVYQIGDVYFVRDGNHRVSVARQLEVPTIQAYVTQVETPVPLTADVQPDDLILKAEYAEFLERTQLAKIRPGADLSVTLPGRYRVLLEHIDVHRYFMGLERQREIAYQEAVGHWYDRVYRPVIDVIRRRGILRDFPDRTETDLYVWLAQHRAELEQALGWEIGPDDAARDLAIQHSAQPRRVVARVGSRLLDAVTPDELEEGPEPGHWRDERQSSRPDDRLFVSILVPLSGKEAGWQAMEQAIEIAHREGGRLLGLHVVPTEVQKDSQAALAVQAEFDRRCRQAGIPGSLAIDAGKVARLICDRSRWADLVVVSLAHPPGSRPRDKLSSGFHTMLLRCPRPLLAVPVSSSSLRSALLAYDGSPKAEEALFVAAYLAGCWQIRLVVVEALEDEDREPGAQARARAYLESRQVRATYRQASGPAADVILASAEAEGSDLILMGGYGHRPVVEVVLGSAVDRVLRQSHRPTLICR